MPSIPSQGTPVVTGPWNASEQIAKIRPETRRHFRAMYAWVSADGGSDKRSSYKFPHHMVGGDGNPGPANLKGVQSAMASVAGSSIPEADKNGVMAHLKRHLDAAPKSAQPKPAPPKRDTTQPGSFLTPVSDYLVGPEQDWKL